MTEPNIETYKPSQDEQIYREDLSRLLNAAEKVKKETYGLHRAIEALYTIGFHDATDEQLSKMKVFDKGLKNVHWAVAEDDIFLNLPEIFDRDLNGLEDSALELSTDTFDPVKTFGIIYRYRAAVVQAEATFLPGSKTSSVSLGFAGELLQALDEFSYAFLEYIYPQT